MTESQNPLQKGAAKVAHVPADAVAAAATVIKVSLDNVATLLEKAIAAGDAGAGTVIDALQSEVETATAQVERLLHLSKAP